MDKASEDSHAMTGHRPVLYDVNDRKSYHRYENCPIALTIAKERRKIITQQIAQHSGMQQCSTCVLIDEPSESHPTRMDLPYLGVDVEPIAKIGVALSGGGHRATLFGLGVLMYLVRARRNEGMSINNDVIEIASVVIAHLG